MEYMPNGQSKLWKLKRGDPPVSPEDRSRWTGCMTQDGTWSVQLPNGRYDLEICAGGTLREPFQISLQGGQSVIEHTKTAKSYTEPCAIDDHKARVTVTNGRLEIQLKASGAKKNEPNAPQINFLRIRVAKD